MSAKARLGHDRPSRTGAGEEASSAHEGRRTSTWATPRALLAGWLALTGLVTSQGAAIGEEGQASWDCAERGPVGGARPPADPKNATLDCGGAKEPIEEPTETLYEAPSEPPRAREQPRIPLGTRIPAVLLEPFTTSPEGGVVTAKVLCDFVSYGRVLVPAGSRVEGLAFGTESDDRARVLIVALVLAARTVFLPAVALDSLGEMGLPGQVLPGGSRFSLLPRALRSRGSRPQTAFSGAALSQLGPAVAQDLTSLTRDWAISSKAIRVPPGARFVIYPRSEVPLP